MTQDTTDPTTRESSTFLPPPAMPSIVASAIGETRTVLALTRRTLALLLSRT